ncbi:putative glyoxalase superfamily protein PhnB [Tamaricihabitans halophyticus]|uniref:Putative glyoxalase superfamily protein PhnB n=1 Tax=Tamaricihabitans halophyticus TaxID=1262583 RepID=A0A4R2QV51_9PSEU|nr:VOC family protein [Tamaricihabitans halophyticus]TCP50911.1 putative glyoxalase superfamily protein PhnB [Tamaricihabitans halophyticus]
MNTTNESATAGTRPAPTVWPTLQARDANALIDFLVDTVGFLRTAVYADGDQVAHAQLDWPEGGGVMLGTHQPGSDWSREPGTAGIYVVTDDPDGLHARLRAAGVEMVRDVADQEYGNRELSIRDPEGNLWSFGYYRGEPRQCA